MSAHAKPALWRAGDAHAGLALTLDSLVNLGLLSSILLSFGMPYELVFGRMVPGSAMGVVVGNVLYAWMGWRLARRTGNTQVTAMPLGLDTPSTIGLALGVLGPAFASQRTHLLAAGMASAAADQAAGEFAWQVGMALMWAMGALKVVTAAMGRWVEQHTPRAGLLGALGGIGLMLLLFMPLVEVFRAPVVGLMSWGLVIVTLVGGLRLPFGLPGIATAVSLSTFLYYLLGPWGFPGVGTFAWPDLALHLKLPTPTLAGITSLPLATPYLPTALPFALLTVIGGINNSTSAQAAGDHFKTRNVLWVAAASTLAAAAMGGVAQPTPYIGHPAYKRMGAGIGYVLGAGLVVGVGASMGLMGWLGTVIPLAAVMPVMMFVGMEITGQAFLHSPKRHLPALLVAFLPTVANLLLIRYEALMGHLHNALATHHLTANTRTGAALADMMEEATLALDFRLWRMLGHGFILTAMLWGSWVAHIIDGATKKAAAVLAICALLTSVGVIHSPDINGAFFLPWLSPSQAVRGFCLGYALLALVCFVLPRMPNKGQHDTSL